MKKTIVGALAAVLLSSGAYAADLYEPQVIEAPQLDAPEVHVVESSGWYIRGDAAYVFNSLRGAHYFQGSNSSDVDFDTATLANSYSAGLGVGYQINNSFRVDATADYMFRSSFAGSTSGSCGVATSCTSTDVAAVTAIGLMANAYVDIGTYGIVTPYVGGGIGGAYVSWSNLENTACDVSDSTNCDATVTHNGAASWRFAYALMAGVSVDITCNLKADIGYRYRRVSAGKMFGYASNGGPGYDKGFTSHEGRAGLRYAFGKTCNDQVYMPPPVSYPPPVYK